MNPLNWLFSFHGRHGRDYFWGGLLIVFLLGGANGLVDGVARFVVGLLTLWIFWAVVAKRAHDRGYSVLMPILVMLPFSVSWVWFALPVTLFGGAVAGLWGALSALTLAGIFFGCWALVAAVWFVVDLGLLKGQRGTNRFGVWPKRLF